jgi:DUF3108-like
LAALALAGCQAQPKAPPTYPFGPFTAEDIVAHLPDRAYTAAELFPLRAWSGEYVVSSPPEAEPAPAPFQLEPAEGGRWRWQFPGDHEVHLTKDADGSLLIAADVDFTQAAHVDYDPPLRRLPATLKPGEAYEGESKMVVKHTANGAVRDQGTCAYKVELIESRAVDTPAGRFDAAIVRMTRSIKLNLAQVEVTIVTAYAPGVGVVAEYVDRNTKALGLFTIQSREKLLLSKGK